MKANRRRSAVAIAFMVCCAGCGAHRAQGEPAAALRRLRVTVDMSDELRTCRHSAAGVVVSLGGKAVEHIQDALDEVFTTQESTDGAPADVTATPRIIAASARRQSPLGRVDAEITYGIWFHTPAGEEITEVTGTGHGSFAYPRLVNLVRGLLHLGTLFIFHGIDERREYASAFRGAEDRATAELKDALQASSELRAYAGSLRTDGRVLSRDARIEALIDAVIDGRSLAVAVLDLEPLAGQPTLVESYLAEELRTRLAKRPGVRTFERALLAGALEELHLNMSDLVDPEHARRFGRLIAADAILTGTTMRFSHEVKLTLRTLDTETGHVIGAGSTLVRTGSGFPVGADGVNARPASTPACPG